MLHVAGKPIQGGSAICRVVVLVRDLREYRHRAVRVELTEQCMSLGRQQEILVPDERLNILEDGRLSEVVVVRLVAQQSGPQLVWIIGGCHHASSDSRGERRIVATS